MIWSQVLVVLLSVILGLFLLAGIVLAVMVVKLTVEIKSVSRDTKQAIDNIERSVGEVTKIAKVVTAVKKTYKSIRRKTNKKED